MARRRFRRRFRRKRRFGHRFRRFHRRMGFRRRFHRRRQRITNRRFPSYQKDVAYRKTVYEAVAIERFDDVTDYGTTIINLADPWDPYAGADFSASGHQEMDQYYTKYICYGSSIKVWATLAGNTEVSDTARFAAVTLRPSMSTDDFTSNPQLESSLKYAKTVWLGGNTVTSSKKPNLKSYMTVKKLTGWTPHTNQTDFTTLIDASPSWATYIGASFTVPRWIISAYTPFTIPGGGNVDLILRIRVKYYSKYFQRKLQPMLTNA